MSCTRVKLTQPVKNCTAHSEENTPSPRAIQVYQPPFSMKHEHQSNYCGVKVKSTKRYAYWVELLQQWVFLVERSYRATGGKEPVYAYRERTNVGLLAAAAVANGWLALEECRMTKAKVLKAADAIEDENEDEGIVNYEGRSDLRMWRDDTEHVIEAKFLRVALKTGSTNRLNRTTLKAVNDASRATTASDNRSRKIALTYVVPTLSDGQYAKLSKDENEAMIQNIVAHICAGNPEFLAYAFAGGVRAAGTKKRMALGAILFGAEIRDA